MVAARVNPFRSTKRQVIWASLTDPYRAGIKAVSNGTQHVRATVSVHSIALKVLDYYGGVATGAAEWDRVAYGSGRTLHRGDRINGVVCLQLLGGTSSGALARSSSGG
ncbi:MAG: hypothetical protein HYY04_15985 [Chloroflexi bacterium]|nr:hypothetical protein [Chloroflexota bacterium]